MAHKLSEDKRALRVNEAVAAYGISRSLLYKLIATGQLATTKVGKRRLIPVAAADALFLKTTAPAA